jgi:hypothetical protein
MRALTRLLLASCFGALVATAGLVALTAPPASAATTFVVDDATDVGIAVPANCTTPIPGACRLVDAFAAAESVGGDVVVSLAVPGGVIASNGDIWNGASGDALTIEGNGQTIDNPNASQTIRADTGAHLTVNDTTITSGYTAITVGTPSVTVTDSTLLSTTTDTNTTAQGIIANTRVDVSRSSITASNFSNGDASGIQSAHGPVAVTDSTVTAGSPNADAAAILAGTGDVTLTGSTIRAVGATDGAGVLASGDQTVTVVNSTLFGSSGNGIENGEGEVDLVYATVVGNGVLAGTHNVVAGDLHAFGSIVAQAFTGANCVVNGSTTSAWNYSDDPDTSSSCQLAAPTDRVGAGNNPLLGTIGANGGPTPTRVPDAASPVIDAIPAAACQDDGATGITADQRGFPRPAVGGGCDIGSVEVQADTPVGPPLVLQPDFPG